MSYDTDIERWVKTLAIHNFKGCPKLQDHVDYHKVGSWIINLNGNSHWVLFINLGKGRTFYFDSFGVVPPEKIVRMFPHVKFNKTDFQKLSNEDCGQYCVLFLYYCKKLGWEEAMRIYKKHCIGNSRWMMRTLDELIKMHGKGLTVNV